jgi:hypothetical protein
LDNVGLEELSESFLIVEKGKHENNRLSGRGDLIRQPEAELFVRLRETWPTGF